MSPKFKEDKRADSSTDIALEALALEALALPTLLSTRSPRSSLALPTLFTGSPCLAKKDAVSESVLESWSPDAYEASIDSAGVELAIGVWSVILMSSVSSIVPRQSFGHLYQVFQPDVLGKRVPPIMLGDRSPTQERSSSLPVLVPPHNCNENGLILLCKSNMMKIFFKICMQ